MNPADDLAEVKEQIAELLETARQLVRGTSEENRAHAYWYAQIRCALDDDHGYLGGGSVTLQDSICALREGEGEPEGEGEEPEYIPARCA